MINKLSWAKDQARTSNSTTIVIDPNTEIAIHVSANSDVPELLFKLKVGTAIGLTKIDDNTELTSAELRLYNHLKVNNQYQKKQIHLKHLIENYQIQLSNITNSEAEKYADIYTGLVNWFTSIDFPNPHQAAFQKLYAVTSEFDPEWETVKKLIK